MGVYDIATLHLDVEAPTALNPFSDVLVTRKFVDAQGKSSEVDGFCDSVNGTRFRLRYMPELPSVVKWSAMFQQDGLARSAQWSMVNMVDTPLKWQSKRGSAIEFPACGFPVESPDFVAFRARNWNGHNYSTAPLFTLRSLDGKPLAQSRRFKVFHGFGDAELHVSGATKTVNLLTAIRLLANRGEARL